MIDLKPWFSVIICGSLEQLLRGLSKLTASCQPACIWNAGSSPPLHDSLEVCKWKRWVKSIKADLLVACQWGVPGYRYLCVAMWLEQNKLLGMKIIFGWFIFFPLTTSNLWPFTTFLLNQNYSMDNSLVKAIWEQPTSSMQYLDTKLTEFMACKDGFAPYSPIGQVKLSFGFCAWSLPLYKSKIALFCEHFQMLLENLLLGTNNRPCQIQCALKHLQGLWKLVSDSWRNMNSLN